MSRTRWILAVTLAALAPTGPEREFPAMPTPQDTDSSTLRFIKAVEALAEVTALVERGGLDKKTFLSLVTETAFASPVYQTYGELIANERFQPAGFRMPLGLKDTELALAAAKGVGAELPLAVLVCEGLHQGIDQGYGDHDWSALALVRAGK